MTLDTENAEGTDSVPSASALATVPTLAPVPVKASEEIPQDATFCGFVVKSASPKYVIRLVSQDGTKTVNFRSSMDTTVTPAKAHSRVLRASVGDSVRATVNAVGIIHSFEIVSKSESVTGIIPGIKPGSGDKVEPKKQAADPVVKAGHKAKREQKKQAKRAAAMGEGTPPETTSATPPATPQDAPSVPARTRCAFCRGPVHPDTLSEVQCANAMRFARRANRRTRVATTTEDDSE